MNVVYGPFSKKCPNRGSIQNLGKAKHDTGGNEVFAQKCVQLYPFLGILFLFLDKFILILKFQDL